MSALGREQQFLLWESSSCPGRTAVPAFGEQLLPWGSRDSCPGGESSNSCLKRAGIPALVGRTGIPALVGRAAIPALGKQILPGRAEIPALGREICNPCPGESSFCFGREQLMPLVGTAAIPALGGGVPAWGESSNSCPWGKAGIPALGEQLLPWRESSNPCPGWGEQLLPGRAAIPALEGRAAIPALGGESSSCLGGEQESLPVSLWPG